ncbi:MAG: lipocalin family protein [Flavobacterium sp.]|nr:lipocalin family protein [Flavobacterium sp.]
MNKRIISLTAMLLCFLSISLTSCDGEDEGGNYVSPNYVAATWELTDIGYLVATPTSTTRIYTPVDANQCESQTFNFTEDLAFSRNYYQQVDDVCAPKAITGTYGLEQGNIVVTYVPDGATESTTITYDIITLTDVALEIAYTDAVTHELVFLKFTKLVPIID